MAAKKGKSSRSVDYFQNKKAWGEEPEVPDEELNAVQFARCLTWYNYMSDRGDPYAYLKTYLEITGDPRLADIKRTPEKLVRPTAGWIARMLTRGFKLPLETIDSFNRLIDDSFRSMELDDDEVDDETTKVVEKPSVHQRTIQKAHDIIGDIEEIVDKWRDQVGFSMYAFLSKSEVPPKIALQIQKHYEPLREEIQNALNPRCKDEQIKEAYSSYKKKDLTNYLSFVTGMVDDIERYTNATKKAVVRKPRATKKVAPESKLKSLQYMKEFPEMKIKSVNPTSFLGASELWLFETKNKKLTVLRAASTKGLDIKGTTVQGYDESSSSSKKVGRNTQVTIDSIVNGTKTQSKRIFEALTSTKTEATGRINDNTILLRVYK